MCETFKKILAIPIGLQDKDRQEIHKVRTILCNKILQRMDQKSQMT